MERMAKSRLPFCNILMRTGGLQRSPSENLELADAMLDSASRQVHDEVLVSIGQCHLTEEGTRSSNSHLGNKDCDHEGHDELHRAGRFHDHHSGCQRHARGPRHECCRANLQERSRTAAQHPAMVSASDMCTFYHKRCLTDLSALSEVT